MAKTQPPFEIPGEMRDFADRSIDHARKAFDDYLRTTRQLVEGMTTSTQEAQANARTAQERTLSYAEANVAAALDYARQMVNAASPADLVEIQRNFVENQSKALADQTRDLADLAQSGGSTGGKRKP